MKNICVNFEMWTIADGSYSPIKKGDLEVFAIGINTLKVRISIRNKKSLVHKKNAQYFFSGEVLYCTYTHQPVIVIDTGNFKFFISGRLVSKYEVGDLIEGEGWLSIDSYEWMHIWYEEGAPHLYYDYSIEKIMGSKMAFEPYWAGLDSEKDGSDYMIMPELDEDNLIEMNNLMDDDMILSHIELKMIKLNENPGGYILHDDDKNFPFGYLHSNNEHNKQDVEEE